MVAACACWSVLLFFGLPSAAADASASGPSLSKLEVKFFQHDYPKDTMSGRLERLEKMVFGEIRSGSDYERLSNLLAAVPNLSPKVSGEDEQEPDIPGAGSGAGSASGTKTATRPQDQSPARNYVPAEGSKYPAVSAIESRVLGKDFAAEPIVKRLDRLETKLFGRPSASDDLMERVDRIKQRAGVDIARQAPAGSDWAEEDDDSDYMTEPTASGEDGKSFRGGDLRQDMQRAFGIPPGGSLTDRYSNNGSYGMGAGGGSSYRQPAPPAKTAAPSYGGAPLPAPPRAARNPAPQPAIGLNDQVGALEHEIFGRSFRDPLPARLNRLESTVFPQEKPAVDKSLPERVSRLLGVIPLSRQPRQVAQNRQPDDLDQDLDDLGAPAPRPAPPRSSGLSKIINSISGLLSGGYPMGGSGALTTDPQTGLLYDGLTGHLIDPVTGVVVGQRLNPGAGMGSGFGSFGSGFSPYGATPYGMGSGSSMRFGFGGMGGLGNFGFGFP
jgi:hypothetical protein